MKLQSVVSMSALHASTSLCEDADTSSQVFPEEQHCGMNVARQSVMSSARSQRDA
jgi:hypothetical protein